jgi:hypothetical protein
MIPFVGNVTAVRDIIAVTIGLSLEELKRKDKFQWLTLVLLLFALIPVIGGAIKGVGRLLLKAEKQASHISDFIAVLNRIGVGDSVKFIKNLDLTQYTAVMLGKWRELLQRIDTVITTTKSKIGNFLPKAYIERLEQIRNGLAALKIEGGKMIPESVKELQLKLRTIQDQMYIGEWNEIPKTLKSSTREIEARLVETVKGGKKWVVERMEFPPARNAEYKWVKGWPDLSEGDFVEKIQLPGGGDLKKFKTIEAFSGPIRAVKLPPGTKIRRVLDASQPTESLADGLWWCYDKHLRGLGIFRSNFQGRKADEISWPSNLTDEWIQFPFPSSFNYVPETRKEILNTGDSIPVTGIWNPCDFRSGCPSFLLAGEKLPNTEIAYEKLERPEFYYEEDGKLYHGRLDFEYKEHPSCWELLWEDTRYRDGTIPEEEKEYLDESCSFPTEPPEPLKQTIT